MPPKIGYAAQDHAAIQQLANDFIQQQLHDQPGKISIQVGNLDTRLKLNECTAMEAFLPTGAQLQGKTNIGIRCNAPNTWSIFIPASISIQMDRLIASKTLQQGKVITEGDFTHQLGELNQPGLVTDETRVLGKVLKLNLQTGQLLKQDMLREPYAIIRGETVKIISEGRGIIIRTEGKAIGNAAIGEAVQVKVNSGHIINGLAAEGGIVFIQQ
jgi:flagella basal body P-ring formation protein FlgA